ncbi:SDR family oxidoreductase [Mycobacterium intracellulare]|uniref:SDR family oxidoreductase n=1 Tax=Mycobacterium intracellulare TaxID=1767 RepID=UPI001EEF0078|nr:SDR family oxidoreductase [Mycobacterium intracellulare]MEE3755344.1 SDR family oxidoreductase [Mycobacterium intracellulare]
MRVLVTGATGSVGIGLILELLARSSVEVVCLVRGLDDDAAQQRLHDALLDAARAYDCTETIDAIRTRCRAVTGDVTAPGCGIEDLARVGEIDEIWHLAASLRYLDRQEASIRAVNVEGTRRALALAERLGVDVFNHASTIGTAGVRSGRHFEAPVAADAQMNNAYERSKRDAEYLVVEAGIATTRIVRLPIIIGHSRTYAMAAANLSGVYTLFNEMRRFRARIEKRLGSYLEHYGVQIIADPHARNAALPVDRVAQAMVTLSLRGAGSGFYTIGNLDSGNAGVLMAGITDALGICEPRYVQDRAMLTSIDQMFTDKLRFHAPYLMQDHVYDCSNLLRYVDSEVISFSTTREVVAAYARHHHGAVGSVSVAGAEG